MTRQNKLFLVFGLHRSGTSATAGVLHHLGVHMGDRLIGADASNAKGHFENVLFMELNEGILRSAGGSWDNPISRNQVSQFHFPTELLKDFLKEERQPVWGLKDPRFLITYEVWKPFLAEQDAITYIFVYRPFQASVSSLVRRNGFDESRAIKILRPYKENMDYYRVALEQNNEDVLDVHYEELIRNPSVFVNEINRRLQLTPNRNLDLVKEFLDEKLRHF